VYTETDLESLKDVCWHEGITIQMNKSQPHVLFHSLPLLPLFFPRAFFIIKNLFFLLKSQLNKTRLLFWLKGASHKLIEKYETTFRKENNTHK